MSKVLQSSCLRCNYERISTEFLIHNRKKGAQVTGVSTIKTIILQKITKVCFRFNLFTFNIKWWKNYLYNESTFLNWFASLKVESSSKKGFFLLMEFKKGLQKLVGIAWCRLNFDIYERYHLILARWYGR